jgi:hypothetical protein
MWNRIPSRRRPKRTDSNFNGVALAVSRRTIDMKNVFAGIGVAVVAFLGAALVGVL